MDTPQHFTARVRRLERLACPTPEDEPLFHALMAIAKDFGLNYKEALNTQSARSGRFTFEENELQEGGAHVIHLPR